MVPTLMEPTLTVPTLMEPTLTVHTLTVPTLMVHLVAPNVLLNRFKEIEKRIYMAWPGFEPGSIAWEASALPITPPPFQSLHFYFLDTNRFTKRQTMSGVESWDRHRMAV